MKLLVLWAIAALILLDVAPLRNVRETVPATNATGMTGILDRQLGWTREHAGYSRVLLVPHGHQFGFGNPAAGSMFRFYGINSYETFTLGRWNNYLRFFMGPREFDQVTRRHSMKFFGIIIGPFTEFFLEEPRMIGLTSTRYFVTCRPDMDEILKENSYAWHLVHEGGERTGSKFSVYENTFALPRAYLVNSYLTTQSEQESLEAIKWNISRLSSLVILEEGAPSFPSASRQADPGSVRIKRLELNEVELYVEADEPSLLVLTDAYYPGWTARVDDIERPIWRANSLFRAVEVPAGSHTVVFEYKPTSLRWGIAISLCTVSVILAGLFIGWLLRSRFTSGVSGKN